MGHVFRSDTDTEVVSHLIETFYDGDHAALQRAITELRGSFALAVIHQEDAREEIIVARAGSPLTIGIGEQEAFVASDVAPMLEYTRRIMYLDDGDLAVVQRGEVRVFDPRAQPTRRTIVDVAWSAESAHRGGYAHYMRKEIDEQPEALRKTLAGRLPSDSPQVAHVPELRQLLARHGLPQRVLITGCGTSFRRTGRQSLIERWSRLPVEVDVASELRYRQPCLDSRTLVIVISQSGETADTLAACAWPRAWRSHLGAVQCLRQHHLPRSHGHRADPGRPEIGVASTKAFTTQNRAAQPDCAAAGPSQRTP